MPIAQVVYPPARVVLQAIPTTNYRGVGVGRYRAQSAAGGTEYINSVEVPLNQAWVIQAIQVYNETRAGGTCAALWFNGVPFGYLSYVNPGVQGVGALWTGSLVLGPGEYLQGIVTGMTAGDFGVLNFHFYQLMET